MRRAMLTDVSIRALKPPEKGQVVYWDKNLSGFGVRVSQGGTKSFVLVAGANRERRTIGRVGVIGLADARAEAKFLLAQRTLGHFRLKSRRFGEALDDFIQKHCKPNNRSSTAKETERLLKKHFMPAFGKLDLDKVKQDAISARLDRLPPSEANHAFTALRTMMTWCVRRGHIEHSPCEAMRLPNKSQTRDRVLSEDEIKAIWHAATDWPYGTLTRLAIATGQRRGELAALRWDWIDDDQIIFPSSITKNGRKHVFPIGALTKSVLDSIPQTGPLLFPARGKPDKPMSGFSKGKRGLEEELRLPRWTLHDCRRTYSSIMASVGVAPHVVEALLNHKSGIVSGVAAVYNRYEYGAEKREAQVRYEEWLLGRHFHEVALLG